MEPKDIKKMTKKELLQEYCATCQMIDEIGCFGSRDLRWREVLEQEIARRGYTLHATYSF